VTAPGTTAPGGTAEAAPAGAPVDGPFVRHAKTHVAVNFDVLLDHYLEAHPSPKPRNDKPGAAEDRRAGFRILLDKFEEENGKVKSQCWCPRVGAGALLTSKPYSWRLRQAFSGSKVRYFAGGNPIQVLEDLELAALMAETDRVAQRVSDLLRNPMRSNALSQLFAIRRVAIEGFEEIAAYDLKGKDAARVRIRTTKLVAPGLTSATAYAEAAIRGRANLLYLGGMGVGAAILIMVAAVLLTYFGGQPALIPGTDLVPKVLVLGGLGAVVSVLQRMTQGNLRTSLDNGQLACFLLGVFRPVIGAVMAVAITLLVLGTILPLDVPEDANVATFFMAGIAFLAGFSERYAQEMIGEARAGARPDDAEQPAAIPGAAPAASGAAPTTVEDGLDGLNGADDSASGDGDAVVMGGARVRSVESTVVESSVVAAPRAAPAAANGRSEADPASRQPVGRPDVGESVESGRASPPISRSNSGK
jgi:hypothetical protein